MLKLAPHESHRTEPTPIMAVPATIHAIGDDESETTTTDDLDRETYLRQCLVRLGRGW